LSLVVKGKSDKGVVRGEGTGVAAQVVGSKGRQKERLTRNDFFFLQSMNFKLLSQINEICVSSCDFLRIRKLRWGRTKKKKPATLLCKHADIYTCFRTVYLVLRPNTISSSKPRKS